MSKLSGSQSVSLKRKRSVLSFKAKLQITEELQQEKTQAEKYEVAKSTVDDIWKDCCQKIQDCLSSSDIPRLANQYDLSMFSDMDISELRAMPGPKLQFLCQTCLLLELPN